MGFEPGRERKPTAQVDRTLVRSEAWAIGRDLEQHAAGLPKIDGAKVLAILDRSHLKARVRQAPPQLLLSCVVSRAESDVMHGADPAGATPEPANLTQIHDGSCRSIAHQPHATIFLTLNPETKSRDEQVSRARIAVSPEGDAVEPTNRMLGRHISTVPPGQSFGG